MRTPLPARVLFAALVVATLAAACDDATDTPTEAATQQDLDETARVVGALMAADQGGDLATVRASAHLALGDDASGMGLNADGRFEGTHLGIHYLLELECYEDSGGATSCGDDVTTSADLVASWSGALEVGGLSVQSELSGDWMIDGLDKETAVFDGDSSARLDVTLELGQQRRTLHVSASAVYDKVLLDTASGRTVGGAATYALDVERLATGPKGTHRALINADARVTFGEDATASLQLSGSSYLVHLDTGTVDRVE
ncbi:MAG: hypothetical protein H6744_16820 [Deltaproteobacteria bacterium]|nr:hypothetical protein [Deltaproteobacteria bacterium]MCB9788345.1 hypothetical protein [Deltaproteobacteria bacterium]